MISRRLNEVRRLLWRWEWGWSRAAEVEEALRRELGRLSSERSLSVGWRHRLRGLAEASYRDQEAALDHALRCLGAARYRQAFHHLCTAEALVRRLNRTTATYDDWQRSRTSWRQMVGRLRLEPFSDLLTLAVVPRLHREAEELLDAGDHRKAAFVLGVAAEAMAILEATCPDAGWTEGLKRRLNRVDPRSLLDDGLRKLLANGRHRLVESLLLDLEIRDGGTTRGAEQERELAATIAATARRADAMAARLARIAP